MKLKLFKTNWEEILDLYSNFTCEYPACERRCYPSDITEEFLCKLHQDWGLST
jgi:hypothetical protein